jgi:hypothetical protein
MRLALGLIALAGCADLHGFQGAWSGSAVEDQSVRVGVTAGAPATLELDAVDRVGLSGSLNLGGVRVALRPVERAGNDALGALELPDSPLRSYLMVAPLREGDALALVSLYDDRVDLRLVRSDSLYAVFHLRR